MQGKVLLRPGSGECYSDSVPPLPIPNREVKTICADGTVPMCMGE